MAPPGRITRRVVGGLALVFSIALGYGTWRDPEFWLTAVQRGDRLMAAGAYADAAEIYRDPWNIGMAQYRNGDFEAAARSFARVPGAIGAFDQGNAWLMHGRYQSAIDSYDRALAFHPDWQAALDNKALALARKQRIEAAGQDRDEESAGAYLPDATVVDAAEEAGSNDDPQDLTSQGLSDIQLRAAWLRRVQTTPADFLQAKFAWQTAHEARRATSPEDQSP